MPSALCVIKMFFFIIAGRTIKKTSLLIKNQTTSNERKKKALVPIILKHTVSSIPNALKTFLYRPSV